MGEDRRTPTQRLDALERKVDRVIERLDHLGLNGDAEAIRSIARMLPQFEALVMHLPALVEMAQDKADAAAFWRTLRRIVGWRHGTKFILSTLLIAVLTALLYFLVGHLWPFPVSK